MTEAFDTIRVATQGDIDNLTHLVVAFRDHLGQALPGKIEIVSSLKKLLIADTVEFLIAYTASDLAVGYGQIRYYYSLWSTGWEAQIEDLFVLPEARRYGLGSKLVHSLMDCARERGCRRIGLNTNEHNNEALRLYTKAGFTTERSRWQGGRQLWLEMPLGEEHNISSRE